MTSVFAGSFQEPFFLLPLFILPACVGMGSQEGRAGTAGEADGMLCVGKHANGPVRSRNLEALYDDTAGRIGLPVSEERTGASPHLSSKNGTDEGAFVYFDSGVSSSELDRAAVERSGRPSTMVDHPEDALDPSTVYGDLSGRRG